MGVVVVTADDAGLAPTTDEAILRCVREGVVRSVSVVAGGDTADDFVKQALDAGADLGLHFNLTEGAAVAGPARSFTDGAGRFLEPAEVWRRAAADELDAGEVQRELMAQWEWLTSRGVEPSHIDGHHHEHVFPVVQWAMTGFEPKLWVRVPEDFASRVGVGPEAPTMLLRWTREFEGPWRRADRCVGCEFAHEPTRDVFLRHLDAEVTEVMVHPGTRACSDFTESPLREAETEVLCEQSLRLALFQAGHQVTTFREIATPG